MTPEELTARLRALDVFAVELPSSISPRAIGPSCSCSGSEDAIAHDVPEPHAMTLSTVDGDGRPNARVLILKAIVTSGGAVPPAGCASRGRIASTRVAALTFYWPQRGRQIRMRGSVTRRSRSQRPRLRAALAHSPRRDARRDRASRSPTPILNRRPTRLRLPASSPSTRPSMRSLRRRSSSGKPIAIDDMCGCASPGRPTAGRPNHSGPDRERPAALEVAPGPLACSLIRSVKADEMDGRRRRRAWRLVDDVSRLAGR
jgi:hypothetical protein